MTANEYYTRLFKQARNASRREHRKENERIREAGRAAFRAGKHIQTCPYGNDTRAGQWRRGYYEEQNEEAGVDRGCGCERNTAKLRRGSRFRCSEVADPERYNVGLALSAMIERPY